MKKKKNRKRYEIELLGIQIRDALRNFTHLLESRSGVLLNEINLMNRTFLNIEESIKAWQSTWKFLTETSPGSTSPPVPESAVAPESASPGTPED
jgi:hypothetical protein